VVETSLEVRYRSRSGHLAIYYAHIMHVTALVFIQLPVKNALPLIDCYSHSI